MLLGEEMEQKEKEFTSAARSDHTPHWRYSEAMCFLFIDYFNASGSALCFYFTCELAIMIPIVWVKKL